MDRSHCKPVWLAVLHDRHTAGVAMVDSSTLALRSALVATNAIPVAEAVEGCVVTVMVIVVVTVGQPPSPARSTAIQKLLQGNLRNSESSDDDLSSRRAGIPDGVSDRHLNASRRTK